MPGLTAAGLEIATLGELRAQINAEWALAFGASMDVSDDSPDGQEIGIHAEIYALLWETLEAIYSSQIKDKAGGAALRELVALVGTTARPASFSSVTLTLTGTPTSPVSAGSLVSTRSTGQQFTTMAAGTITAVEAWAAAEWFTGERSVSAGNVYQVIDPGLTGISAAPAPTHTDPSPSADTADGGGVVWRFLGKGSGAVDVAARATAVGPLVAVAGDLTVRDTPAGGWEGVTNVLDAVLGRLEMTDPELRVLSDIELAQAGTGPPDAIVADLLRVGEGTLNPVDAATVFVNNTDFTDVDGVPPHSVEALVHGGEDQAIRDQLLASVTGGIRTHGSIVGTALDVKGNAQVVKFSRTVEILVYVAVTLVKDPSVYPADGDAQVKTAIAVAGNGKPDGTDVVSSAVLARVFAVPGVISVDLPFLGTAPSPTLTTTIAVSLRQRAVFDSSRITVASSNGVP